MADTTLTNGNFWSTVFTTPITAINDTDSVLVKAASGTTDTIITAALLRAYLQKGITPSIGTDGYWYIGGVLIKDASGNPIQISAEGKTPTIAMKTIGGVKGLYLTYKGSSAEDTDWTLLVTATDLMFTFDDLTDAQKQSFLTYFTDAIANCNTATTNANAATANCETATSKANTATDKANTAATAATTAASEATTAAANANAAASSVENLSALYVYGIEWDTTVSNSACTRIGNAELHKSLPIQSLMRRCVLKDDGTVNYYLHTNDSSKRDNSAAANLDGTDGMVEVEIPDVYVRFEMDGVKRRCLMSEVALPGFTKWSKNYVSAYEATIDRTNNKLASVVNATAQFRGGGNQSGWDGTFKSQLGKPATDTSLTSFRSLARARGSVDWNCNTYQAQRELYWLFAVEYCNFNSQADYNAALDSNGYHQGGLGKGVTDFGNWDLFGYYPIIPCGVTNSLGNHTGYVEYSVAKSSDGSVAAQTMQVPSYRGVENPFGHVWKWTDGCRVMIQSAGDGGLSLFYVCDNPTSFSSSGVAGYDYRGNIPRTEGYVKEVILGEFGEIMPLSVGAGSTTFFCDYFYTSIPTSGTSERGVLFGGAASYGVLAGFVSANTAATASTAAANFGSRLCFVPAA